MAVTLKGNIARTKTLWRALPEDILIDPELNGRHDNTEVESLAADILAHGQNTPCLIRRNDAGQPVLVYGHRRWRAVQLINSRKKHGEQKVELECNYESMTEEEALVAAITENRFRKDVSPMDDCYNIQKLKKLNKLSDEQIARIYFPEAHSAQAKTDAVRWVTERAGLIELAPEAVAAVKDGRAKITAAVELSRLSKDQQRDVVAASTSTLAGKARIKVKDVKKAKPAPAPKKPVGSVPAKVSPERILAAAEALACAIDLWLEDATDEAEAEAKIIATHEAYRKLQPFIKAVGKAA